MECLQLKLPASIGQLIGLNNCTYDWTFRLRLLHLLMAMVLKRNSNSMRELKTHFKPFTPHKLLRFGFKFCIEFNQYVYHLRFDVGFFSSCLLSASDNFHMLLVKFLSRGTFTFQNTAGNFANWKLLETQCDANSSRIWIMVGDIYRCEQQFFNCTKINISVAAWIVESKKKMSPAKARFYYRLVGYFLFSCDKKKDYFCHLHIIRSLGTQLLLIDTGTSWMQM